MKREQEARHTVMLVDDEDNVLVALSRLLRKESYELVTAGSGSEALALMAEQPVDVIVTDQQMPGMTGMELLKQVKNEYPNTMRMMLTGHADVNVATTAINDGEVCRFITKPVQSDELKLAIRNAIEYAEMSAALREQATRDALTGLYNRREMDRFLREEMNRHHRYDHPFTLLMADIDHFKKVNDAHGHQVGDDVLRWVAERFQESVRPLDRVVRYGGEEIAIIAPHTTPDNAFAMAERLRNLVAAQPFTVSRGDGGTLEIPITISIGIAGMPMDADSEEGLISAADRALYEAKRNGRNCTVRTSDPIEDALSAGPSQEAVVQED
ncbi:MAG: diguanylate cyclase [Candidatus Hydrogenedentes bacterium]|nr:diguanylate cyclase [Candidatus Hydrogenedentota bacterium]